MAAKTKKIMNFIGASDIRLGCIMDDIHLIHMNGELSLEDFDRSNEWVERLTSSSFFELKPKSNQMPFIALTDCGKMVAEMAFGILRLPHKEVVKMVREMKEAN